MRNDFLLAGVILMAVSGSAFSQVSCDTDCNARCPSRWIKVGPFKTKYRDPTCKLSCEVAKPTSCVVGVSIPVPRGTIEEVQKKLEQTCAAGFEVVTKAVILYSPPGQTQQDARLIEQVTRDLLGARLFSSNDFNGVSISFHKLLKGTDGIAPDRNIIYLNEDLRSAPLFDIAVKMAHEMKHIEQYRRHGTDSFKCNYTKHFIKCGQCQDSKHEMEREAYEFEDQARFVMTAYYEQRSMPFVGEESSSLLGTYGVVDGGCQPRVGPARIYRRADGILVAANECRNETQLAVQEAKGQVMALHWANGLIGDVRGGAIYWRNNTQWYRSTATPPLVGSYIVDRGGCSPRIGPARVYVGNNGTLFAANECGNESELLVQQDGSIVATRWGSLVGDVTAGGAYIGWRNATNWRRVQ